MVLAMLAATLLLQGADIHGRWEIQQRTIGPNDIVQYTLRSDDGGNSGNSFASESIPPSFRDLTRRQLASPVRTVTSFEIVEEAGTFVCDGDIQAGNGSGTFVFHPDPRFIGEMESSGYLNLQDKQLVTLAIVEMPAQFPADLRGAGLSARPSFDQLVGMWVLGVTGDFIRGIQRVGYMPTATNLTGMRALGVTADFARDVRQMYPNASIDNLIGMRALGITVDFAREVRQNNPNASIDDLTSMRIFAVTRSR